jgi:transcriptional regulator with XRE-family HTH domain
MATDLDPTVIGTRIAKRRHQLGLKQEELASDLKVTKSTVANWERGKHLPIRHMGAIELRLGISLTDGEPEPREASQGELDDAIDHARQTLDRLIAMRDGDANGDDDSKAS